MPVNGRRTDVGARDVQALGLDLGLSDKVTAVVLRNAVDSVDGRLPLLDEPSRDAARYRRLLRTTARA